MKKCPFCAEEIQDAAVKCKHCGSMLTEASPNAALDDEIKRLLGVGKKIDAIKLTRERKPTLGLAGAKAYVEAVEKGTDPEQAVAAAPKNANAAGGCLIAILFLGVLSYNAGNWLPHVFDWLNRVPPTASRQGPQPSAQTTPAPPPASAPAPTQDDADEFITKMVNLGLIKRMDVTTGKFYIDGPLWEGFELNQKEMIVKGISGYRNTKHGLPQVTLYESRSGKELANYGPFAGVTIR